MKKLILLLLITNISWGVSVTPPRIVTMPLDLYDSSNKTLPNGDVRVSVTTYDKRGTFIHHGSKKVIPKAQYEFMLKRSNAVLEMRPPTTPRYAELQGMAGSAVHIGRNLVLTNQHVLDPKHLNTTECSFFRVINYQGDSFDCKKVHYCNVAEDVCLIEMAPMKKVKRDCFFCSGKKYEVTLAQGPSLKLKAQYNLSQSEMDSEVTTAIGNSGGFGIHYSQGRGVVITHDQIIFYAPLTKGNSGGALINDEGLLIGVVKNQTPVFISDDPSLAYNVALPSSSVISLIRDALQHDPDTLHKFNQSVVE